MSQGESHGSRIRHSSVVVANAFLRFLKYWWVFLWVFIYRIAPRSGCSSKLKPPESERRGVRVSYCSIGTHHAYILEASAFSCSRHEELSPPRLISKNFRSGFLLHFKRGSGFSRPRPLKKLVGTGHPSWECRSPQILEES